MSNYLVFTDEAGNYKSHPSQRHIDSHPFYIRAYVRMSAEDYRQYQIDMQRINGMYQIPFEEEIKWSDIGTKHKKGAPRTSTIEQMSLDRLKKYFRAVLEAATSKESTSVVYTVTDVVGQTCRIRDDDIYTYHLQAAFQRIRMGIEPHDFAVFIMDELNEGTVKQIKSACHKFTVHGDFVEYKNLYQGVLTENSLYSPGIQLADYAAGIMNCYLRRNLLSPKNYQFAADLYRDFIIKVLRRSKEGIVVGFGVVNIPKKTTFLPVLEQIFDEI